jgi:hypothetical protein
MKRWSQGHLDECIMREPSCWTSGQRVDCPVPRLPRRRGFSRLCAEAGRDVAPLSGLQQAQDHHADVYGAAAPHEPAGGRDRDQTVTRFFTELDLATVASA